MPPATSSAPRRARTASSPRTSSWTARRRCSASTPSTPPPRRPPPSRSRTRWPRPTSGGSRACRSPTPRAGRAPPTPAAKRVASTFTDDVYFRSADPNDPAPTRHAHEPDLTCSRAARRRVGLLDAGGDARDDRHHDARHRRLRRGQRRPADEPQLAGSQGGLRGRRGGGELLPVPPRRRQRLLDEVHERREAERDGEQPGQPEVERDGPTRASGATSPARPRITRSSCCPRRARRRASRATSRA